METRKLDLSSNNAQILEFDPLKDLSGFYDTVFAWDVDKEAQEVQKQVRIRRDCEERPEVDTQPEEFDTDHPDSHITTISCVPVHYRISTSSVEDIKNPMVYGALSGHPVFGKTRRNNVRKTWGKENVVFFVVAGNWIDIELEYNEEKDIIWVDQPDTYITEEYSPRKGALTFKTEALLVAMYDQVVKQNPIVEYIFKTDDDCYVDTLLLRETIDNLVSEGKTIDYGGSLMRGNRPDRSEWTHWYASYTIYPFTYYPSYATGGGYIVSHSFLTVAVGEGHLAKIPYVTLEDAAVGLLAERSGFEPEYTHNIHYRLRQNTTQRVELQHDVQNEKLMLELHDIVMSQVNQ